MSFTKKILSAIATGALVMQAMAVPVLANTTLVISGNGEGTTNQTNYTTSNSTSVTQSNSANISNNITANGSSGSNSASGNTGGNVSINTGGATSGVTVQNTANQNVANVACCNSGNTVVQTIGNGEASNNYTKVGVTNSNSIGQTNNGTVANTVNQSATTGSNGASSNTNGTVSINTGAATIGTEIKNVLNSNAAAVSGCCQGDVTATIARNGEQSVNQIDLTLSNSNSLGQSNTANVTNSANANASSGSNSANGDTGGSVAITTGAAIAESAISTAANTNEAVVGGGSTGPSLTLAITGNGEESNNFLNLSSSHSNSLGQTNSASVRNTVYANAYSGNNSASSDTNGDVMIGTGMAEASLGITNRLNFNAADLSCCAFSDVTGVISGNGESSPNVLTASLSNSQGVGQTNGSGREGSWSNTGTASPNSGSNSAGSNTGSVLVSTGGVLSGADVVNSANGNVYGTTLPIVWPFDGLSFGFSLGGLFGV